MITNMFNAMARYAEGLKGTTKGTKDLTQGIWGLIGAATAAGNPLALAGFAAMTAYANSRKTTIDIAPGGMKAMTEAMKQVPDMAMQFDGVANSMSAIASGIAEIDVAIE